MRKAAVIGHPVNHSLSPMIFEFLARRLKKPLKYSKIDIAPSRLKSRLKTLSGEGFVGFNVTIPHKEKVLGSMNYLSREARTIGAVNVIKASSRGWKGYNTDVIGVSETLREKKARVKGQSVVVFGAGGAAKAVCFALKQKRAARVWVVNRSLPRARKLCRTFGRRFQAVRQVSEVSGSPTLYINATPLGMKGFPKASLLPKSVGRPRVPRVLAFDLVYRPEKTLFLETARKFRISHVGGLDMLIWQALETWEIWFEEIPRKTAVKKALKVYLRKRLRS